MWFPEHIFLAFRMNEKGQYVAKSYPLGFAKIPNCLILENRIRPQIKSNLILRGQRKNPQGSWLFFTGIRPIGDNWFYGNHYNPKTKKRSLILMRFSDGNLELEMFFFNNFNKDFPKQVEKFANIFISKLNK